MNDRLLQMMLLEMKEMLEATKKDYQLLLIAYEKAKEELTQEESAAYQTIIVYGKTQIENGEAQLSLTTFKEIMAYKEVPGPSDEEVEAAASLLFKAGKL